MSYYRRFFLDPIRALGRYAKYLPKDTWESMRGMRDSLTPPTRLMFDGIPDLAVFKRNGEEFFTHYVRLCALKPDESILDVGCGIGRKTIPLIKYLSDRGKYEGFDVVRSHIGWCQKAISKKHPNFHFQHVPVYNRHYNPSGRNSAEQFRFPFDDETFDFVVLGSVFTHMLPEEVSNYLSEVSRVLRPGGRSLITFFLVNGESVRLMHARKSALEFRNEHAIYRTVSDKVPEKAIAYDESYVMGLYGKNGLDILKPIHYGSWCGRKHFLSYQDLIVAQKHDTREVFRHELPAFFRPSGRQIWWSCIGQKALFVCRICSPEN